MGDIWPYGPPDRVGYNVLYNSVIAARGNAYEANTLAAIGMAESGSDIRVINDTPATGDYSAGAFQVNYFGKLWAGRVAEFGTPAQLVASGAPGQARAALVILGQQGFGAWSTYNSGAYRQYLNGAGGTPPETGPGGTGGAALPTIGEGSAGAAVRTLQTDLDTLGDHLAIDGVFGPATLAAVVHYQATYGIRADGVVGPVTWAALARSLAALQTPANTPSAPPPPNEPPSGIEPASLAEWSNVVLAAGPELGASLARLNGWANAIGGIR